MTNIKYEVLGGRFLSHICLDHPTTRERVNAYNGVKQPSGPRVGSNPCLNCEHFISKDEEAKIVKCSNPSKSEDNLNIHRYIFGDVQND